jgi:hypothetical protein
MSNLRYCNYSGEIERIGTVTTVAKLRVSKSVCASPEYSAGPTI